MRIANIDNMRKRLLSALLAVLMVLCTAPLTVLVATGTVFAGDGDVAINATNFPDANFRAFVSTYDTTKADGTSGTDGVLSATELSAVTSMDCSNKGIADLTGIEYFTSLTRLDCGNYDDETNDNTIESLDVSANINLDTLICSGNKLTALDVSANTRLLNLRCDGNNITSLELGSNTTLSRLYCENNALTSLDVSKNTRLEWLNCENNALTTLDLSKNTNLGNNYGGLVCSNNSLTSLDVSNGIFDLPDRTFECNDNTYKITPVDGKYDLKNLPEGFNLSKASNWKGAKVENGILIIDKGADKVTYTYDCGDEMTAEFTLLFDKSDDAKSPKTGDNDNLILWLALLLVCGGATGVATGVGLSRNRKCSR